MKLEVYNDYDEWYWDVVRTDTLEPQYEHWQHDPNHWV